MNSELEGFAECFVELLVVLFVFSNFVHHFNALLHRFLLITLKNYFLGFENEKLTVGGFLVRCQEADPRSQQLL